MKQKTSKGTVTQAGVNWRDAMHGHCRRLDTLAELLEACGQTLEAEAAVGVGGSVRHEVDAMKVLLEQLEPPR